MLKRAFPQEFPPHLSFEEPIEPVIGAAPLGNHPLQFEHMHATQFEQFCWWLLQRSYDVEGCQLVGGPGQSQGGIDLFGYDRENHEQVIVFECKCWKDFNPSELRNAVRRFLAGPWADPGTRFILIVAQQSTRQLARVWHEMREELSSRKIIGQLWTGLHLTELIRLNPDILIRFFPQATTSVYCNEWMRRVDFMTQLQKALVNERADVRRLANQFLQDEGDKGNEALKLEQIYSREHSWTIDSTWVHVDALLPGSRFPTGSAAVVVKKQSTSGLTVALSQDWLLKNLLSHPGAPVEHSYRPFIYGPTTPNPDSDFTVDLHCARLQIPFVGLNAMCTAFDKLTPVYVDALRALEKRWDAEGRPFIGHGDSTVVAICSMPSRVWDAILAFVRAHDADAGGSDWHLFDSNPHYVKIYTTKHHPDFDRGYHAFIRARTDVEGLCFGDDVVLTWDPPSSFDDFKLTPRQWMSCAEAASWLQDKLLPAVGKWVVEQELRSCQPWERRARRKEWTSVWNDQTKIWNHYQHCLLGDDHYKSIGLLATVEELQSNLDHGAPKLYLSLEDTHFLYRGVITVLKGERGHVPYICSNLGLGHSFNTHKEVINALEQRVSDSIVLSPGYAVRCLLSAMLEGLRDDDSWLDPYDVEQIFSALMPLIHHHDVAHLFERHSRWF